jgi:hypothetical protein
VPLIDRDKKNVDMLKKIEVLSGAMNQIEQNQKDRMKFRVNRKLLI